MGIKCGLVRGGSLWSMESMIKHMKGGLSEYLRVNRVCRRNDLPGWLKSMLVDKTPDKPKWIILNGEPYTIMPNGEVRRGHD